MKALYVSHDHEVTTRAERIIEPLHIKLYPGKGKIESPGRVDRLMRLSESLSQRKMARRLT